MAVQTLGQMNCPATLDRVCEATCKLRTALCQCKERCSHDFASRNMCEKLGA